MRILAVDRRECWVGSPYYSGFLDDCLVSFFFQNKVWFPNIALEVDFFGLKAYCQALTLALYSRTVDYCIVPTNPLVFHLWAGTRDLSHCLYR